MTLAAVVDAHNDAALEALASKGLVRRARRDFDKGKATVEHADESRATVIADGQRVVMDSDGPAAASCPCPAHGVCRHILLAVLALRSALGDEHEAGEQSASDALRALDQATLEKFAGADWARALALLEEPAQIVEDGPNVTVRHDGFDASVTFIRGQTLKDAVYRGPRTRRRLLVTLAVVQLRRAAGVVADVPDGQGPAPSRVSPEYLAQMRTSLSRAVASVLPGRSPSAHDELFDLAISSRVEALPRLASELRGLAAQARLAITRHIDFHPTGFLKSAARTHALLEALASAPDETAYVGAVKRDYRPLGELSLILMGATRWRYASGARGITAYAFAPDLSEWFSLVDGRAAGTDPGFNPSNRYAGALWGAGSIGGLIGRPLTLPDARVAEDHSLALTQPQPARKGEGKARIETLAQTGALIRDWATLRESLAARFGRGLARRAVPQPALIAPTGFAGFGFNDMDQVYEWEVLDESGGRLVLSIPGNDHEVALRMRQMARRIDALLVEASLSERGLSYRPVSVYARAGDSLDIVNVDFDPWPEQRRVDKVLERLSDLIGTSDAPLLDVPDPLLRIVTDAADALVAALGQTGGSDLAKTHERCEAAGLLTLGSAVDACARAPSVQAVLRAAYLVSEAEAALAFEA